MKGLELEGCNGTVGKFRGLKEKAKVQIGKRHGLKCNFCKQEDETLPWTTSHLAGRRPPLSTMGGSRKWLRDFKVGPKPT